LLEAKSPFGGTFAHSAAATASYMQQSLSMLFCVVGDLLTLLQRGFRSVTDRGTLCQDLVRFIPSNAYCSSGFVLPFR
jgi:hypothetical protein